MIQRAPADHDASDDEKSFVDALNAFVSDLKSPEGLEPGERPLHNPSMPSQTSFRLDPSSGDAIDDATFTQRTSASLVVVSLIGVDFDRLASRSSSWPLDGRYGIQHRDHHPGIVNIRRRECDRNGNTPSIDREVVFGAFSPAIRGIRAKRLAPFFAGT